MSAGPPRVSALSFPPRFPQVSRSLPCVRFSSTFVPHGFASSLPHLWFSCPSRMHSRSGWLARLCFPCLSSTVVFSPAFPSASFPFLASGSSHLGSTASPLAHVPGSIIPGSLAVSGSTTPSSGFGSVARGLRRSAPHTTPPERHLRSERRRRINLSPNEVLWTGNEGLWVLISGAARYSKSPIS